MNKPSKAQTPEIIKTKPTVFPLGFTVSQVENSFVVIDFIDNLNGRHTIIESVALPLEKANQLSQAITEATENGKERK